jgi:hypothetical protein
VVAVAQDQMQRVVHDATIGMARGAQVLGFRVGYCYPLSHGQAATNRCRCQWLLSFAGASFTLCVCDACYSPMPQQTAA